MIVMEKVTIMGNGHIRMIYALYNWSLIKMTQLIQIISRHGIKKQYELQINVIF